MRQDKNRHIFNARSRRKPVAENARPSKKKNDQRDDATVLPAAINDNERLTPRQRGYVRDHNKIVDEASGRTVLMKAVLDGNLDLAVRIMRSGGDVERVDKAGNTALHHAVRYGSPEMVKVLLAAGADPSARNGAMKTPLLMAFEKMETAPLATQLLDAGADITLADKAGVLPVHMAAQLGYVGGSLDILVRMVEAMPDPNQRDGKGATILHYAVRGGTAAVLEKLLFYRLDTDAATHDGKTCLHEAAARGETGCADALLQGWAVGLLNAVDHMGRTPLHEAVESGHAALVEEMMVQGALANHHDVDGNTPAHIAARKGQVDLLYVLMENSAPLDSAAGKGRMSPMLVAIRAGKRPAAQMLLSQGADPNRPDDEGVTPLMRAAKHGMYDLVDAMLEQGGNAAQLDNAGRNTLHYCADGIPSSLLARLVKASGGLEVRDSFGRTPLLAALNDGQADAALEMIKAGAAVDAKDESSCTPLHIAIGLRRTDLITALIMRGVDVNAREEDYGMTPLHIAAQTGQVAEVRRLLLHGAKIEARDDFNRTPLHLAVTRKPGALLVVRFLLERGSDVMARDKHGATPYDLAFTQRQDPIMSVFKVHLKRRGQSHTPRHVPPFGIPPQWP